MSSPTFFAALAAAPFLIVWLPFTIVETGRLIAAAVRSNGGRRHD